MCGKLSMLDLSPLFSVPLLAISCANMGVLCIGWWGCTGPPSLCWTMPSTSCTCSCSRGGRCRDQDSLGGWGCRNRAWSLFDALTSVYLSQPSTSSRDMLVNAREAFISAFSGAPSQATIEKQVASRCKKALRYLTTIQSFNHKTQIAFQPNPSQLSKGEKFCEAFVLFVLPSLLPCLVTSLPPRTPPTPPNPTTQTPTPQPGSGPCIQCSDF